MGNVALGLKTRISVVAGAFDAFDTWMSWESELVHFSWNENTCSVS
jgi:hypothetical protein